MDRTSNTNNYIYIAPEDENVLRFIKKQKNFNRNHILVNCCLWAAVMFGYSYAMSLTKKIVKMQNEIEHLKNCEKK